MGTPEFAVPMLEALLESSHEVVVVITAPDKPAGRGMQLTESKVKQLAKQKGLMILQPEKLKNESFLAELKTLNADLFVVVAFRMLPEVVWNMPPIGTINLHASLLPQYRGAAPINWAIINGEKETGVTTFFIQQEIDTGQIIFKESIPIGENENVGELYERLMHLGAKVLRKTVDAIAEDNYPQIPQEDSTELKSAPKIFKETCKIDWNNSAKDIHNFIRGLSPYPAAFTLLDGKNFKIFKAIPVYEKVSGKSSGSYSTDGKSFLHLYCTGGYLDIKECQVEGKKRMSVQEFLRGVKLG
ncbi:MAG: methionyl-tRNA formyltransferase [Bacteroidetes bacterium]|nr:methionyl-tRNA formyltransferase [Bacteroidota bacterium]